MTLIEKIVGVYMIVCTALMLALWRWSSRNANEKRDTGGSQPDGD